MLGLRRVWPATALALVLAGSACGGDSGEDDAKNVRTAYTQLQARFEARDSKGVCDRISEAAKEQVGSLGHASPTTCVKDVRQLFKWIKAEPAGRATRPRAMSVAMDGGTATVTAGLPSAARTKVRFVEEDGAWKLDSFFAITGPPPPDML